MFDSLIQESKEWKKKGKNIGQTDNPTLDIVNLGNKFDNSILGNEKVTSCYCQLMTSGNFKVYRATR